MKAIRTYGKHREWLGIVWGIQPRCSKPGHSWQFFFVHVPFEKRPFWVFADSEIRTHDGALHDDFCEQNRSWDDPRTIMSDTLGTYQNFMSPGCQIYHQFFEWIGLYTHFDKKSLNKSNIPASFAKKQRPK